MAEPIKENDNASVFEPIRPGLALKVIFERNMGLSLDYVSKVSGIDMETLWQITENGRPIDKEIGHKLKAAFGDTGTTLVRMQFIFDYFKRSGVFPSPEETYSL